MPILIIVAIIAGALFLLSKQAKYTPGPPPPTPPIPPVPPSPGPPRPIGGLGAKALEFEARLLAATTNAAVRAAMSSISQDPAWNGVLTNEERQYLSNLNNYLIGTMPIDIIPVPPTPPKPPTPPEPTPVPYCDAIIAGNKVRIFQGTPEYDMYCGTPGPWPL